MSRRGWALFTALSVIWGVNYLFIRVAVRDFTPASIVFFRAAPVALMLAPMPAVRRHLAELLRRWQSLLAFTVTEYALPWFLTSKAEEQLSSSLTGLLFATVPLVSVLLARLNGDEERFGRRQLIGLFIGIVGVALLVGIDVHGAAAWPIAEVFVAAIGYAVAPRIFYRYLSDLTSLSVLATSLATIAIVCAPLVLTTLPRHLSVEPLTAMIALTLIPTLLGFLCLFALIREVGPVRAN